MARRQQFAAFSYLRDRALSVCSLAFLHELSDPFTRAQPPLAARWQEIIERPAGELGEALDAACQACEQEWPTQLEGFFGDRRFAEESPSALTSAVRGVGKLLANHATAVTADRGDVLASVHQEMRTLTSKQWQGAFFTPWTVAEAIARISIPDHPIESDLWVLDPACGGGVLLHAAYEIYREQHGPVGSRAITLIGVDIDPRVCQLARATLLLAGADPDQYWIAHGNSLAQAICGKDRTGTLRTLEFHVTLANPPFGQKVDWAVLENAASSGPLVIPARVLNRHIPRLAPVQTSAPDPTSAPTSKPKRARSTRSATKRPRAAKPASKKPAERKQRAA
jgi:type I restriction-modification system DNA methylase subunit